MMCTSLLREVIVPSHAPVLITVPKDAKINIDLKRMLLHFTLCLPSKDKLLTEEESLESLGSVLVCALAPRM